MIWPRFLLFVILFNLVIAKKNAIDDGATSDASTGVDDSTTHSDEESPKEAELQSLKLSQLQSRAIDAGASQGEIDKALDDKDPKEAIAALVLSKEADGDKDNANSDTVGFNPFFLSAGENDDNSTNLSHPECVHGDWNHTLKMCVCHKHWRLEPFWNTIGLLAGQCTQFSCSSDKQCEEALDIKGAKCPLPGWNCNCGFSHSAFGNKHGQCMWRYFVLGVSSGQYFSLVMTQLWKALLVLIVISLPFGANYAGAGTASGYSLSLLRQDLAWTLFSIKVSVWLYCFCILGYLFLLFLWSLPIVGQFLLTMLILVCCCMLAFCNIEHVLDGEALECCLGGATSDSCVELACCMHASALPTDVTIDPMMFYVFDASAPGHYDFGCCSCFKSNFRLLFWNFPRVPANMLGGLLGFCAGTHALSRRERPPAECVVRWLSVPCVTFQSRNEQWRLLVERWLREDADNFMNSRLGMPPVGRVATGGDYPQKIGEVLVDLGSGSFTKNDGIFNYDDYKANCCWICRDSSREHWDKWTFCGHVFCDSCSTEMMKRRMPCPLCRVRSTSVLRKRKFDPTSGGLE